MRRELDIFLSALMFFTRIPVPGWVGYTFNPDYLQRSARYFSLIGWLVGGVGAMTYVAAAWWLPVPLAVLLSTAATIWLTGAFHEDGWADVCDGFGGGMTRADVLEIMKDSRLGTYGTIGLVMVLALKVGALIAISADGLVWAVLLAAHPLSRLAATTVIFSQRYVYADEESKAKPLATSISPVSLAVAFIFGGLPLLLIPFKLWWGTAAVVGITWWAARWFKRRIGGYTGDCLGAVQQLSETAFYLTAVGLLA